MAGKKLEFEGKRPPEPLIVVPSRKLAECLAKMGICTEPPAAAKKPVEKKSIAAIERMLGSTDYETNFSAFEAICSNIEDLEEKMKKDYIDGMQAEELKVNYKLLPRSLLQLNREDLRLIAALTNSISVCMAILNNKLPEDIKEAAEKRVAEIKV